MKLIDALFENTDITVRTDLTQFDNLTDLKKIEKSSLILIHEQCRARVSSQFSGMAVTDARGVGLMGLFTTISLAMISAAYAIRNSDAACTFLMLAMTAVSNIIAASIAAWSIFPQQIDYPGDNPSQWVGDENLISLKRVDQEIETLYSMIWLCKIQTFRNSEICRIKSYRQRFSILVSLASISAMILSYMTIV